jgi:uncharacterized protein (DUF1330 family)
VSTSGAIHLKAIARYEIQSGGPAFGPQRSGDAGTSVVRLAVDSLRYLTRESDAVEEILHVCRLDRCPRHHRSGGYAKFSPGSVGILMPCLARHGGEILVGTPGDRVGWLAEGPHDLVLVMRFPSAAALHAFGNGPECAPAKALGLASTAARIEYIAAGFEALK